MDIIQHPNKILKQKSIEVPVGNITKPKTKNIIQKMKAALVDSINEGKGGVALAAPQIGYNLRIFIILEDLLKISKGQITFSSLLSSASSMNPPTSYVGGKSFLTNAKISEDKLKFLIFVNPEIIKKSRKKTVFQEGCLSLDGVFAKIKRPEKLTVKAFDENGKKFQLSATKIVAEAIQHEIDHLDGALFIDKTALLLE